MNQSDQVRKSGPSEPTTSIRAPQDDLEDTEAHVRYAVTDAGDTEDAEGHRRFDITDAGDTEDAEGHKRRD